MIELILGLACLGVVVFGAVGLVMLGVIGGASKKAGKIRAGQMARKDELLDALFDGRRVVTTRINLETLPADVTIEGGGERGYDLTSRVNVTEIGEAADLVFTRRDAQPPVAPEPAPTSWD